MSVKKVRRDTRRGKTQISVIASALDEQSALPAFFSRMRKIMDNEANYDWKIVIFDNGSSDDTWQIIVKEALTDTRVRGYRMSRTFALDAALHAGVSLINSDAVILITTDLQDPPELIPNLLRKWELGFPHVVVRITSRDSISILRRMLTKAHYKLNSWASGGLIPENVSDFRLMDRSVYKTIQKIPEGGRFLRGVVAWTGFPTAFIDLDRPRRHSGKSKTKYGDLIRYSIRGILSFSNRPISWITSLGVGLSVLTPLLLIVYSILWVTKGVPFSGFGTIIGLQLVTFTLITIFLSVIGEYISLIYNETRKQPTYVIWDSTHRE